MKKMILSAAVAMSLAGAAHAGHGNGRYDDGFADYARVEHVEPIVREVRISEPRKECWQEEVRYLERPGFVQSNVGLLVGGTLGALIGGEIGHGSGRKIATIGGGLLGAAAGHGYQNRNYPPRYNEHVSYEDRCRTIDNFYTEERIEGYDVTYRYQGKRFQTQLPYDPGSRIRVGVDVRPLEP